MISFHFSEWAPMIAALVAVATLVWNIRKEIKSHQQKNLEIKRQAKMKIISDLVALRFVLTNSQKDAESVQNSALEFNCALSRIPIDFINHKEVLSEYHELGDSFTAEKFYNLIKEMLKASDVPVPEYFTVELLESVPSKSNLQHNF